MFLVNSEPLDILFATTDPLAFTFHENHVNPPPPKEVLHPVPRRFIMMGPQVSLPTGDVVISLDCQNS